MSFNFSKVGETAATVVGGALDKKKLYLDKDCTDDDYVKSFTKIELPKESKFQQMPRSDFNSEVYYITGSRGSGKSWYTEKLIEQIRSVHKDYPIYVISPLDDNYNQFKNMKRVIIDETLITDPISYKEFANSIVVFDDIEAITNNKILNSLMETMKEIVFVGRHANIQCFYISHIACNGPKTKAILKETNSITCFPSSFDCTTGYLMKSYFGLTTNEIEFVLSHNSRFCTYYKLAPNYLIFENEIYTKKEFYKLANDYVRKKNVERKALEKNEMMIKMNELKGIKTEPKNTKKTKK